MLVQSTRIVGKYFSLDENCSFTAVIAILENWPQICYMNFLKKTPETLKTCFGCFYINIQREAPFRGGPALIPLVRCCDHVLLTTTSRMSFILRRLCNVDYMLLNHERARVLQRLLLFVVCCRRRCRGLSLSSVVSLSPVVFVRPTACGAIAMKNDVKCMSRNCDDKSTTRYEKIEFTLCMSMRNDRDGKC